MMSKETRDMIDEMHRGMIESWKRELQNPEISSYQKETLEYLVKSMEENFLYTYTAVKLPYHTMVVKHKRTEPRKMVWEEENMFFLRRCWRKFTIWFDWYLNK